MSAGAEAKPREARSARPGAIEGGRHAGLRTAMCVIEAAE
jgi:hypothetical protein